MTTKTFDPQDLTRASETLRAYDEWKIFTHAKADGDAWGSSTALYAAGKALGKRVSWHNPDKELSDRYKHLAGFEAHETLEKFDFPDEVGVLYVFLDCSNEERGTQGFDPSRGLNSLNIDHHEDNSQFALVNCVDGAASSTCEVLYRVFMAGGWEVTRGIAESLYTGIFTDTGSFTFSNTSPLTHRITAELMELGADASYLSDVLSQNKNSADFLLWSRAMSRVKMFGPGNIFALSILYRSDFDETGADMTGTEGLSSMFMTIRGVKLIATITEYPSGEIRLSVRSREGSPFGAGEFARTLGGGGHERAAGASFKVSINDAMSELERLIMQKYHECIDTH